MMLVAVKRNIQYNKFNDYVFDDVINYILATNSIM